jgi:outer membrane protein assembly factor BamB
MTRVKWSLVLSAIALALSVAQAAPVPKDEAPQSVPFPGGVADTSAKVAYVVNTSGGIDALDLDKGDLLWDTKDPAKPLAVAGKKLVAQVPVKDKANAIKVVVLDTAAKGKKVSESDAITFPDWVSVGGGYGRSFASRGTVLDGDLLLSWEARSWYAGGARPTPEREKAERRQESGVAKVSLEKGKVEMLAADKAPAGAGPKVPKDLENVASQQYWTGSDWQTKALVAGTKLAALEVTDAGGGKSVMTLKRWDLTGGKEDEPVKLLEGKSLWPQVSSDGRYLFVHQAVPKEQLAEGDYAWWVFDLETGKQVAKLPYDGALAEPVVVGPRLYYMASGQRKLGPGPMVQPRSVKAVDLKTGKVAWEHDIEGVKILPPLP